MKNNKEEIFEKAFSMFLSEHYELVTIKKIEQETGYSRGGIFYYAENKEDLFRKIMDYFVFEKQNIKRKVSVRSVTLYGFIEEYLKGVQATVKMLRSYVPHLSLSKLARSYLALGLQAGNHYEGWETKIHEVFDAEIQCWEEVICQAQKNGEIRSDIASRTLAEMFRFVFLGLSYSDALDKGINIEHLRELFMDLYNMIKMK